MKKLLIVAILTCLTFGLHAASEGDSNLYVGVATFPFQLYDLKTIDINDYPWTNTAADVIRIDLSKGYVDTERMYGIMAGYEGYITDNFAILFEAKGGFFGAEIPLNLAGGFVIGASGGINVGEALTLSVVGKIGALFGVINFGAVSIVGGSATTDYVQTKQNDINDAIWSGYEMTATIGGLELDLGIKGVLDVGGAGIFIESGVTGAALGFMNLTAYDFDNKAIKIPKEIIMDTGTTNQADLSKVAKGLSAGGYLNIGINFRL